MLPTLRSWWKEERRSPPSRATLLRRLGLCLLVLTPLLALQVQRRTEAIARERQGQRDDTLAIMESALAVAERASFDWGHWDAAYAFVHGRNPQFVAHDLSTGAVFDDGTVMVMLRPNRSVALIHAAAPFQRPSYSQLIRCARDNVQQLTGLNSTIRLACLNDAGALYLGAATPLSNSNGTAPAAGTQVMLSPLLKPEYSPRIRQRLTTLQRELMFLPSGSQTRRQQAELIQPRIHSSGGRLLGIQRPDLLPILGQSLLSDLPLLLAVPGLLLLLRVLALLERRRQRIRRLQVDRRASHQIRETCRALNQLFDAVLPDRGGEDSSRILGRISRAALAGSEPGGRSSAGLERVSQRFQHFLQTASELALFDALTQLPNRRYFIEQLADTAAHHREHEQRFAILFIDIDKFKIINDTYGHAVGDGVLVSVCQRLKRVMRAGDFLARYGGDELAVILDLADVARANPAELSQIARKRARAMVDSLQEPLLMGELSIAVSLSIGITLVDPQEGDVSAIMQRSDQAMYQAKVAGKNRCYIFDPEKDRDARGLHEHLQDIARALKDGEFEKELVDPSSMLSEAYRSLGTSLQFTTENGLPKTLLLSSAGPGEGKSSSAMAISKHFSNLGLKVLLVDADLRNPSIHHKLGLENSIGLSNYLTGACSPPDAFQRPANSTLAVMTSGPLPPNAADILGSPRFMSLLSVGLEVFDFIVVDGPPVMGLADANSTEMDPNTPHPVIDLMHDQRDVSDKGGTQRLGACFAILEPGSKVHAAYGEPAISERHRHRYELNSIWKPKFEAAGLRCSGVSPDRRLVDFIEMVGTT